MFGFVSSLDFIECYLLSSIITFKVQYGKSISSPTSFSSVQFWPKASHLQLNYVQFSSISFSCNAIAEKVTMIRAPFGQPNVKSCRQYSVNPLGTGVGLSRRQSLRLFSSLTFLGVSMPAFRFDISVAKFDARVHLVWTLLGVFFFLRSLYYKW